MYIKRGMPATTIFEKQERVGYALCVPHAARQQQLQK